MVPTTIEDRVLYALKRSGEAGDGGREEESGRRRGQEAKVKVFTAA